MKDEYDFSKGKRRAILPSKGKSRITIYIDDVVLEEFRARAEKAGTGYQTMINDALKEYLAQNVDKPVTESSLRRILQEELPQLARLTVPTP
ncbi:MAG: BrnA antitoxin family protein [Ardenticatenaceae bacterium]|nr:BrnA antitoxin family protein [Ardenticatenaceae bacterium]